MKNRLILLISILLLLAFLSPASSEIYTWKDKDGNIFFSDSPPSGVEAQKKKVREDRIERPEIKEDTLIQKSNLSPLKETRPYRDINVIMYMTPWCGYCKKAREYINSLGVSLTEYNISKDKDKGKEMLNKSGGSNGVPLIDVEGLIIRGYIPDAIKTAVEKRRSL